MAISGTDSLEVPIPYIRPIFEAYVREYLHKIWTYMVLTYLHVLDPGFPIDQWEFQDPIHGGTYHIFLCYILYRPKFQGISQNMARNMVRLHTSTPG